MRNSRWNLGNHGRVSLSHATSLEGWTHFERVWWVLAVLIAIVLMGILSVVAITLRARKPRLAITLIWLSIVGITMAAWGDLFTWGITVSLPAAILLIPAAIKMRRTR
ncbi:MAG: hypothetical protein HYX80_08425 [Chloroflexi bacterium]|nr:hypothetical protein [Chloroflexota bacterium]